MKTSYVECRGIIIRETAAAIQVQKTRGQTPYWFPRSVIPRLLKTRDDVANEMRVTFDAPEWIVEKNNCWELVP